MNAVNATREKSTKGKVIYQTEKTNNIKDEICSKIKLLQYLQEGCTIEFFAGGFGAEPHWLEKNKESTTFYTKHTEYRVLEKPKEIQTYTVTYLNHRGEVMTWATTGKERFYDESSGLGEMCSVLLKIHDELIGSGEMCSEILKIHVDTVRI